MTIKWRNIFLFILVLLIVLVALNHGEFFSDLITRMRFTRSYRTSDDRFFDLLVFGMIGIVIVAIVKILTQSGNKNP